MREFKFRAWGASEQTEWGKAMQYSFDIEPDGEIFCGGDAQLDWVLMQYTGLKDKKGVEIYEGDILNTDDGKRYVQVVWFKPQACFDTIPIKITEDTSKFIALYNSAWSYRCKVIGNIYENPELLKSI